MDTSPLDEKIQRQVWNGVIPIELNLAQSEIATLNAPEPYYVRINQWRELNIFLISKNSYWHQESDISPL